MTPNSTISEIPAFESDRAISVQGKLVKVPRVQVGNRDIVVVGKWLKIAGFHDEEYVEGQSILAPDQVIAELKGQKIDADIFSFSQRLPDVIPAYKYPMHWDNVAALPIVSYDHWLGSLSQDTRRNVRLAGKRGVVFRTVSFSDELVRGITDIYNETPVRQGRHFWHYGKKVEDVKRDNASYVERSRFIGAYLESELIGFIKMVYVDGFASIMQILAKAAHQNLRPTNGLIAKAVEVCDQESRSHLLYCKYVYHKGYQDPLTEFKRRNKFQQVLIPRYFVPLTLRGRLAMSLNLHLALSELLPQWLVNSLLKARRKYSEVKGD